VQIYDCNDSGAQSWYFTGSTIKNTKSGLCLDVVGASTTKEANVWAYTCNGTPAQKWVRYTPGSALEVEVEELEGPDQLAEVHPEMKLEEQPRPDVQQMMEKPEGEHMSASSLEVEKPEGAELAEDESTEDANTIMATVLGTAYQYKNPHSGLCLDVTWMSSSNGANVRVSTCHGASDYYIGAQEWVYTSGALKNSHSSKCLDVKGGKMASGTNVQIYDCNDSGAQSWYFTGSTIKNTKSGLCLDVIGASTTKEANVWAYTCNGTPAQKWVRYTPGSAMAMIENVPTGSMVVPLVGGALAVVALGLYANKRRSQRGDGFQPLVDKAQLVDEA